MYRGRLERDLFLWVQKGLLEQNVANSLLAELDTRESTFSVGRVLSVLAACLLSVAILLLIASNWDAIPRVVRLVGIIGFIWAFFVAGARAQEAGLKTLAASLLILAAASFGGAIALVGQMYHLSGDNWKAALVWFAGVAVAAALFRSSALTVITGFLSWLVFGTYYSEQMSLFETSLPWLTPILAFIILALVYWTGSARARHTAYLLLFALISVVYAEWNDAMLAVVIAAAGFVAYLLASMPASPFRRFAAAAGPAPEFYFYSLSVLGLVLLHFEYKSVEWIAILGVVTLALSIVGLILSGRNNGALRYLAYLIFAGECLYLASETIGSILGTAGVFLCSGVIVGLLAWIVVRLEKRFAGSNTIEGAN